MFYGDRVRLRAIEREDIPTFVRWFNDPEVRQHILMYEPMSLAKEERWFEAHLDRKDEVILALEARIEDTWTHIGNLGLHKLDWKHRSAALGIVIGEKGHWGKGYGTEAVRLMLRFAFHELGLHRVEIEAFEGNARALRCYEKAGFRSEGTRRHAFYRDGRWIDVHVMSVLEPEFTAAHPPLGGHDAG